MLAQRPEVVPHAHRTDLFLTLFASLPSWFRTRAALQIEILPVRHQLVVLKRSQRGRLRLSSVDRVFWVCLSRFWRNWCSALLIVKPETVIAWHRIGFRLYWAWKSRRGIPGRPVVCQEIRDLIRKMRHVNPFLGAPRIHGELRKLGIEVSQATVAKYMAPGRKPPSQTRRTFLNNHAKQLVSTDFFVVPTGSFRILFVFIVLAHLRRRVVLFNLMAHPTSEWAAQQIAEAFLRTVLRAICCMIVIRSVKTRFVSECEGWGCRKSSQPRGRHGRVPMWSA